MDGKVGGCATVGRLPASLACLDDVKLSSSQIYIKLHAAIECWKELKLVMACGWWRGILVESLKVKRMFNVFSLNS